MNQLAKAATVYQKPWYARPMAMLRLNKKVIVIGGGISGAATAYSLAIRGYMVTLYEKNPQLAMEASGNYQAILYGNFSGTNSSLLELSRASYNYSNYLIKSLLNPGVEYQVCGILQLAYNENRLKQQQQILSANPPTEFCIGANRSDMEKLAGVEINCDSGMYFPSGLWLNPQALVNKLANHPNIEIKLNSPVNSIQFTEEWQIETKNGITDSTQTLIVCNSHMLNQFIPTQELYIHKSRGQISKIKNSLGLKTIVCADGYITPNLGEYFTLGATFNNDTDTGIRYSEHEKNIRQLSPYIADLAAKINLDTIDGKASLRAHTSDYMPLTGPVSDFAMFKQCYSALAKDANYKLDTPCPYLPGLYVNAAFGSKGMLIAPLCAEMIADYIDNKPFSGSEKLRQALHPNRLWIKQIIKQ